MRKRKFAPRARQFLSSLLVLAMALQFTLPCAQALQADFRYGDALTEYARQAYDALCSGIETLAEGGELPLIRVENVPVGEWENVQIGGLREIPMALAAFRLDYPEAFWVDYDKAIEKCGIYLGENVGESYEYLEFRMERGSYYLDDYQDAAAVASARQALTELVARGIQAVPESDTAERITALFQWAVTAGDLPAGLERAGLLRLVCQRAGQLCILAQGTVEGVPRQWNLIALDGGWYGADLDRELLLAGRQTTDGTGIFGETHQPDMVYTMPPEICETSYFENVLTVTAADGGEARGFPTWAAARRAGVFTSGCTVTVTGKVTIYESDCLPGALVVDGGVLELKADVLLSVLGGVTVVNSGEATGTGKVGTYLADESQLQALRAFTASGTSYAEQTVYLTTDIVLSAPWEPIGEGFLGTLDGAGHTIQGIEVTTAGTPAGLFSTLNGAVMNLGLTACRIDAASGNAGAVAGEVSATGHVQNCYSKGEVSGGTSGGLVGRLFGKIEASYSSCTVTAPTADGTAGGLVGTVESGGLLSDVYAGGSVSAGGVAGENVYAGGLAGTVVVGGKVSQGYATAAVFAMGRVGQNAGGIAGSVAGSADGGGTVSSCVALNSEIRGFAYRIAKAEDDTYSNLNDNYALQSLPAEKVGPGTPDGENLSFAGAVDGEFYQSTCGFAGSVWSFKADHLPALVGLAGQSTAVSSKENGHLYCTCSVEAISIDNTQLDLIIPCENATTVSAAIQTSGGNVTGNCPTHGAGTTSMSYVLGPIVDLATGNTVAGTAAKKTFAEIDGGGLLTVKKPCKVTVTATAAHSASGNSASAQSVFCVLQQVRVTPTETGKSYDGAAPGDIPYAMTPAGAANPAGRLRLKDSGADAGIYHFDLSGLATDGFSFVLATAADGSPYRYVITPAVPAVRLSGRTATYDGQAVTLTPDADFGLAARVIYYTDESCTVAMAGPPVKAGTYYAKAYVSATGNYAGAESGQAVIQISKATAPGGTTAVSLKAGGTVRVELDALFSGASAPMGAASYCITSVDDVNGILQGITPGEIAETALTLTASPTAQAEQSATLHIEIRSQNYEPISVTLAATVKNLKSVTPSGPLEPVALTYGSTLGSVVGYKAPAFVSDGKVVSGTFAWAIPSQMPTVETETVSWAFTPRDSDYETVYGTVPVNVTPRPLSLTPDTVYKVYGDGDPALSYTIEEGTLVGGDQLKPPLIRQSGEAVGGYRVELDPAGGNPNYRLTITEIENKFIIKPKPVAIMPKAGQSGPYNGSVTPDSPILYTHTPLAFDDQLVGGLVLAGKNAGIWRIAQGTLAVGGGKGENYLLTLAEVDYTVDKVPLSPVAYLSGITGKVYDGKADVGGVGHIALSGAVAGEQPTASATFRFDSAAAGANKTVTVTGIALDRISAEQSWADNYILTATGLEPQPTTLNVTPRAIQFTEAASRDKIYDGNTMAYAENGGLRMSGVAEADSRTLNADLSAALATFSQTAVGNGLLVTFSGYAVTGPSSASYTVVQPPAVTASITPFPLKIGSVQAEDKPYDGTDTASATAVLTAKAGGLPAEERTYSVEARFDGASVQNGRKVAVSVTLTGETARNYTLDMPTAQTSANITKSPTVPTVQPEVLTLTHGETVGAQAGVMLSERLTLAPADLGTLSWSLESVEDSTGLFTGGTGPALTAGGLLTYSIPITAQVGTAVLSVSISSENYATVQISVHVTVQPRASVIITGITAENRPYNGVPFTPGGEPVSSHPGFTDFASLEYQYEGTTSAGIAYGPTLEAPTGAGSYTLTASVPAQDAAWQGGQDPVEFSITPALLTVCAEDKAITQGQVLPPFTVGYRGLAEGDTPEQLGIANTYQAALSPEHAGTETLSAGSYPILLLGSAALENYDITTADGTLTVSAPYVAPPANKDGVQTGLGSLGLSVGNKQDERRVLVNVPDEALKRSASGAKDGVALTVQTKHAVDALSVTLSAEGWKQLTNVGGLVLSTNIGTMTLDGEAARAVGEKAAGQEVTFRLECYSPRRYGLDILAGGTAVTNLEGRIEVALPCEPSAVELPGGLAVWTRAPSGRAVPVLGSVYSAERKAVIFKTGSLTDYEIQYHQTAFSDREGGSVDAAIEACARWGMFKGISDNRFGPELEMSRSMMATILDRITGEDAVASTSYIDVSASAWYAPSIGWATKAGIISGVGPNRLAPEAGLSKEQMVVMLYRYCDYADLYVASADKGNSPVPDGTVSWAFEAIQWAVNAGILELGDDGDLSQPITRAEAARILSAFVAAII